jgi:hypothetical protein
MLQALYFQRLALYLRASLFAALLAACAAVPPVGEPRPAFGSVNGSFMALLQTHIPQFSLQTNHTENSTDLDAAIPIAAAYRTSPMGGRYLCPRQQDSSCLSIAIGDAVLHQPQLLEKIKIIASKPCEYLPATPAAPTDSDAGERLDKRLDRRDLLEIKAYFGCDGAARPRRSMYFYAIRHAAKNMDASQMGALLEANIASRFVITTNEGK